MSSCKVEYIAATTASCQTIWMSRLIGEFINNEQLKAKVMVDNKSAITLSKNPVHHSRTKHIDTRHHFIRQCVEDMKIKTGFIRTEDQLANIFTKALGRLKFQEMRCLIGIRNTHMEELEHEGD